MNTTTGAKERMDSATNINEVVLKRLKLGLSWRISTELLESFVIPSGIDVEAFTDWMGDSIAINVKQEILGQQLRKIVVRYPADWKQAVKERFVPEWMRWHWPVRYNETVIDVQALYPRIALPHEQDIAVIVRILKQGTAQIEKS